MFFLKHPFITKQKILLSQILKSNSIKEVALILCIKITQNIFSRHPAYLKVSFLLNALLLEFKTKGNEKYINFSDLDNIPSISLESQKKLLKKLNKHNAIKKDLLIQKKISELNFKVSGPSREWINSKKFEIDIAEQNNYFTSKKLLGPEWYMYIGHLAFLAYLAVWKKKDLKILKVENYHIANEELFKIIENNFEIKNCSSLEYASLMLSSPKSFYLLGSTEFSENEEPFKDIAMKAFANKQEKPLYKSSNFSNLTSILDKNILLGHQIFNSFVTLHVRGRDISKQNSRSMHARDAFIFNYKKTIEYLISNGFNVVRIGEYKSFPLPYINGFIDLTQKIYGNEIDFQLLSNTKFHIGTSSGPLNVPPMFGKPVLLTNAVSPKLNFRYPNSFLIPKVWINKKNQNELSFHDLLKSDLHLIEYHSEVDQYILRENTSNEILSAVKDMLKLVHKDQNSNNLFLDICKKYDYYLSKNNIAPNINDMPLAPSFLEKQLIKKYS
tara:strand:+ start:491 stop:1987 length:1497 start_codon:yes stop_codon:yes gene_type:complete